MWIQYRKLRAHPEGVHRVRDVLFDQNVHEGIVEVSEDVGRALTSRCQHCGGMVDYEVVSAPASESIPAAAEDNGEDVLPKKRGRPKKR